MTTTAAHSLRAAQVGETLVTVECKRAAEGWTQLLRLLDGFAESHRP